MGEQTDGRVSGAVERRIKSIDAPNWSTRDLLASATQAVCSDCFLSDELAQTEGMTESSESQHIGAERELPFWTQSAAKTAACTTARQPVSRSIEHEDRRTTRSANYSFS